MEFHSRFEVSWEVSSNTRNKYHVKSEKWNVCRPENKTKFAFSNINVVNQSDAIENVTLWLCSGGVACWWSLDSHIKIDACVNFSVDWKRKREIYNKLSINYRYCCWFAHKKMRTFDQCTVYRIAHGWVELCDNRIQNRIILN